MSEAHLLRTRIDRAGHSAAITGISHEQNARAAQFNKAQAKFNARVSALSQHCGEIKVDTKDREAVLQERAAKASQPK